MADKSKIEWTDATWNPITGCTLVDEGCRHCYAAHLITSWYAIGNHPSRKGLARKNAAGESKFTGEVRFNEQWLDQPLRWKKPRKIFVCAHGDLFHPSVPDEWIDRVFAVMALAPQHTFQVLTKRPQRAREYFREYFREYLARQDGRRHPAMTVAALMAATGRNNTPDLDLTIWPLPNVWLGTSISDQASADLRIPDLLACPAAVRFVSAEPLLRPVDLSWALPDIRTACCPQCGFRTNIFGPVCPNDGATMREDIGIDWVIVGGESGPHARPMRPDWARTLRDQCAAAGVPFHFKQWGEWLPGDQFDFLGDQIDGCQFGRFNDVGDWVYPCSQTLARTGRHTMFRVGKKLAGRLLDDVTHDGFPGVSDG